MEAPRTREYLPRLQMKKLRHRGLEELAHGPTAPEGQSWESDPGRLAPEPEDFSPFALLWGSCDRAGVLGGARGA